MTRRYEIFDVFSDRILQGNPLAIVLDGAGLTDAQMQTIAGEFNLSETVFVQPPENPAHTARIRIFTPRRELPFAGHPTVGTAICLAYQRFGDEDRDSFEEQDVLIVLEETIGPVRCGVRLFGGSDFAEFDGPTLPSLERTEFDRVEIAAACGLDPTEIGFENHLPRLWSAGVPFTAVPVRDRTALAKVQSIEPHWSGVFGDEGVYLYCRDPQGHDNHFRARMLDPLAGIPEDPATGSAAAALSGAIYHFDDLPDGNHGFVIEQGFEMGRPSLIHLEIIADKGAMSGLRIGGNAVRVAKGEIAV